MNSRHLLTAQAGATPRASARGQRRGFGPIEYGALDEPPVVQRRAPNPNTLSYWLFRKGGMVVVVMAALIGLGLFGAVFGPR